MSNNTTSRELTEEEAQAEIDIAQMARVFLNQLLGYLQAIPQEDNSFIYQTALVYANKHNALVFKRSFDKFGVTFSFKSKTSLFDVINTEMHRRIITDKNKHNSITKH